MRLLIAMIASCCAVAGYSQDTSATADTASTETPEVTTTQEGSDVATTAGIDNHGNGKGCGCGDNKPKS
ncbi:MAG: hypothetical protein WCF19_02835 [Chlamydiales bacterium]